MSAVAVVGGGPAGLAAAEALARSGAAVTVYERMPSPARKFLIAGRGGLNLTHGEAFERFVTRYETLPEPLRAALDAFPPDALRRWSEELGEPTFVGSSGRVFPRSFKASPLLRAWLRRLDALGVRVVLRHRWRGFASGGALLFDGPDGPVEVTSDAAVLALGGASWPRLGSDGAWTGILQEAGVATALLRPANAGYLVPWSPHFAERFAGEPLKRIALAYEGRRVRGEAVISSSGLEGGAVYALGGRLRDAVLERGEAVLALDLRPDLDEGVLAQRLAAARQGQSLSNILRKAAGLSPVGIGLLREVAGVSLPREPEALAGLVKHLPLRVTGVAGLERAISSAGGVLFDEIDASFMLRRLPGVFVAGEMLDWEAPTGGYLLQASFATGIAAARGAVAWLEDGRRLG